MNCGREPLASASELRRPTDCRTIVFVFAKGCHLSAPGLANEGYRTFKMPHPYGPSEIVRAEMAALKRALGGSVNQKRSVVVVPLVPNFTEGRVKRLLGFSSRMSYLLTICGSSLSNDSGY